MPNALAAITASPAGVLVLMNCQSSAEHLFGQIAGWDGAKAPAEPASADRHGLRTYGIGAQILRDLNVGQMKLLAPRKMPSMAGFRSPLRVTIATLPNLPATHRRPTHEPLHSHPDLNGEGLHIGIVRARFNEEIGQAELEACLKELAELGVDERDVMVATVPGALELGVALSHMAETFEFDALIALGAVIRGETYHFEVVSNEMATAITRISLETGIPIANGVLTVDTDEQAQARAGKGATAPRWPSKWPTWSRRWNPRKKTKTTRTKILTTKKTTTSADSAAQARANARSARRRANSRCRAYTPGCCAGRGHAGRRRDRRPSARHRGFFRGRRAMVQDLLHGVLREAPTLRERFTPYVDRPLAELSPVEHGILLIGSFELIHHVEVPYKSPSMKPWNWQVLRRHRRLQVRQRRARQAGGRRARARGQAAAQQRR